MFGDFVSYLASWEDWVGPRGILMRILEHLEYSAMALGIAALIAIPLGLAIGHVGRGQTLIVGVANVLRAIPSLGLMTLLILFISSDLIPPLIALVVLAVPPLLAGVYSGIQNVPPSTVDAARSFGMSEWQVLSRVEIPNALPLIVSGFRGATLQVVATATIAAYVSLGGLGRFIFDGLATFDYGKVLVGAIFVTILGIGLDLLLAWIALLVEPGSGRLSRRDRGLEAEIERRTARDVTATR